MSITVRHILLALGTSLLLSTVSGCGLFREVSESRTDDAAPLFETDPIRYSTEIVVTGENGESSAIRSALEKHSQLIQLRDQLPDGMIGLMRRARQDRENAVKLLHSLGYYDGSAATDVQEADAPGGSAKVTLTLTPGPRYRIGRTDLSYRPSPAPLPPFPGITPDPVPETLPIAAGQPAEVDGVLSAVDEIPEALHRSGYPQAEVVSSRYTLNKTEKTLNADIVKP